MEGEKKRIEARIPKEVLEEAIEFQKKYGYSRDRAWGELIKKGLEAEKEE